MYQRGCRCLPCALENSRYLARLSAGESRRVPASDVSEHIDLLLESGWTLRLIRDELALAPSTLWSIRSAQTSVNSRVASAVQALEPFQASRRLVAEPLLRALDRAAERHGGLACLLEPSDRRAYYRAARRGWIAEPTADRIAVEYLGEPVVTLYGPDPQLWRAAQ